MIRQTTIFMLSRSVDRLILCHLFGRAQVLLHDIAGTATINVFIFFILFFSWLSISPVDFVFEQTSQLEWCCKILETHTCTHTHWQSHSIFLPSFLSFPLIYDLERNLDFTHSRRRQNSSSVRADVYDYYWRTFGLTVETFVLFARQEFPMKKWGIMHAFYVRR